MITKYITSRITRRFRKNGKRFRCEFQEQGKKDFRYECGFDDLHEAMSYASLIVRFFQQVEAARVMDENSRTVFFACQISPQANDILEREQLSYQVREAPAVYAQLTMTGFDRQASQKTLARQKHKLEETFAKLRQLHDELNAQLYTRPTERPTIHSPEDAADILQCFIGALDHEELWVLDLDTRNRVMSLTALYKGSVNQSQVRIAEVFRQAIVENAPAIIVAHNHPSGDPTPSPDDVAVTRSIAQSGKLLDIEVLDHLIIGGGKFVSLKERGLGF